MRLAVVGVGLIGGSIGLAARARLGAEVHGWDPAPLDEALARGAITHAHPALEAAVEGAEAVFVAAPVGALPDTVRAVLSAAGPETVVSDAGSTKRAVVEAVDDPRFVGGHPLAGAETAGVRHARADLFDGATWYLTPTTRAQGTLLHRLFQLVAQLGARPVALDAATHDALLATVSHLPHVLANVLAGQGARALGDERLPHTGPSFRDMTRIAGANTAMWRDVYVANADALVRAIDATLERLGEARALLASGDRDGIAAWNDAAREDRRRLLEAGLAGGPVHELRVTVPNRPGVVAEVALALGAAGVNILDMGLHPAPDRATGRIALWLAGERAADDAERAIAALGLPVARP